MCSKNMYCTWDVYKRQAVHFACQHAIHSIHGWEKDTKYTRPRIYTVPKEVRTTMCELYCLPKRRMYTRNILVQSNLVIIVLLKKFPSKRNIFFLPYLFPLFFFPKPLDRTRCYTLQHIFIHNIIDLLLPNYYYCYV